ncbi:hypothetical protein ACFL52_00725, partial [Candidatus Margulisiibacteriota bacterium]
MISRAKITNFAKMQGAIRRINRKARRLKEFGFKFDLIKTNLTESTTRTLQEQGFYNPSRIEQLERTFDIMFESIRSVERSFDVKAYLENVSLVASDEMILAKIKQFIDFPRETELIDRQKRINTAIALCNTKQEVAETIVQILHFEFGGSNPTIGFSQQENDGKEYFYPTEIWLEERDIVNTLEKALHKKLGQYPILISEDSPNFYVQTYLSGETYINQQMSKDRLFEIILNFMDTSLSKAPLVVKVTAKALAALPNRPYLMVPLIAPRGEKYGVVSFLKQSGDLKLREIKSIENFLQ